MESYYSESVIAGNREGEYGGEGYFIKEFFLDSKCESAEDVYPKCIVQGEGELDYLVHFLLDNSYWYC